MDKFNSAVLFLLFFSCYLGCSKESAAEPKINTAPVNSVSDAVILTTKAYTLGYLYTLEPYFTFTREVPFESQSPSYAITNLISDANGRRAFYTLTCSLQDKIVYQADIANIKYDTYDRVSKFQVVYSFNATGNRYDFDITDIARDNQGITLAYKADITADVNGKHVTGILQYPY
jgi:hypothetical protein